MLNGLIGLPYERGGRGPSAFDCAGLVVELQRRRGTIVAAPPTGLSGISDMFAMARILSAQWRRLPNAQAWSVVYFPTVAHLGTMIDGRNFIHAAEDVGSVHISSLDDGFWKRKLRLFYTPEVLR